MSRLYSAIDFLRRMKWRVLVAAIIVLPILALVWFAVKPSRPTYVTEKAVRSDLKQTVQAVGTVISDHNLSLQFPTTGIVAVVTVKEGDRVRAGQTLAQLRSGTLNADIASAEGRVLSAQATLRALQEGSRPEDIAISQADVQSKQSSLDAVKQSLEAVKRDAATNLASYVANVPGVAQQQLTTTDIAIGAITGVFSNNDIADAITTSGNSDFDMLRQRLTADQQMIRQMETSIAPTEFAASIAFLQQVRFAIQTVSNDADRAYRLVDGLSLKSSFTQANKTAYKTTISTQRTALQAAIASIDTTAKTMADASAGYTKQITQDQADIATYQAALQTAQAQLQLKLAPPRQTDIDAAVATLQQARGSLAAAVANKQNTVLSSPMDGVITKVNLKVGEFTPVGVAVTMLGSSPYRIEMFVSEIDIPRVQLGQTGSIELDAFRGTHFSLHVSEIDTASTNKDGVSKYRVRLDFAYPHSELKVGMTGDTEIDTGLKQNVVSVPQRAVIGSATGSIVRILNDDGTIEQRPVVTGMEGSDSNIEIVRGVQEGETVIVLVKK